MNAVEDKIKELEASVKTAPGSPAFARLADHYRAMGHVDDAIALCEEGVKNNPGYATGHLLLGRCYYEKVRVDDAVVEFKAVLKLDRKNIFALKIMGDIMAQKGKKREAAAFYRKAADYDPRNTGIQELFKRFEKYYQDPAAAAAGNESPHPDFSPAAGITGAVRDRIADAEMIERDTGLRNRDSTDSRILSSAKGVHEEIIEPPSPAADASVDAAVSFDDLDKAAQESESRAAEVVAAAEIPETLEIPQAAEIPETLEIPQAAEIPETVETPQAAEIPEAVEMSQAAEISDTVEIPPTAEIPESDGLTEAVAATSPGTEMVDLPPEMTGAREERVGEFKVRKSLLDRLMDEQNALFETAAGPESAEPAAEIPEPSTGPGPSDDEPGGQSPGMDGYYNVQGEEGGESQDDAQLLGIDDVEMREGIDEEAVASELPAGVSDEAPLPAPVSAIPTILDEVSLPGAAAPEKPPVPELPEEADDDHGVSFGDLLQDMDADDEIKRFVQTLKEEEAPVPVPNPAPAASAAPSSPVMTEEIKSPAAAEDSGISASAAGMDGFYNVTGDTATESDSLDAAGDIDRVEIESALSEDSIALDAAPPAEDGPLQVELGEDVEFELPVLPDEVKDAAPAPVAPELPAAPAVPPKEAGRRKNEKGKTRTGTRVVSNLATASLGDIYLRQGHKEQALAVFQKILAQDPGNAETRRKVEQLEKEIENES